jgi:hypothetical protein
VQNEDALAQRGRLSANYHVFAVHRHAAQGDLAGHSVREALPEASPETATELSPRECCASTPPAPAALVIVEGGALGNAAAGDGVLDAGAGAVVAGVFADPAVDPSVEPAADPVVDAARDGSSAAALVAEEDCPEAWPSAVKAEPLASCAALPLTALAVPPPARCADSAPVVAGLARGVGRSGNLSNDVLPAPRPSKAPWPVMPPIPLVMDPPRAPAPPPNTPAYAGVTMANTVAALIPAMICLVFIVDLLQVTLAHREVFAK